MNNLEKIREYWNTRSEGYRQQIEKEREEHKDEFYKEYFRQIPEVSKVLDIGCGPGFFSLLLASLGMNVTAADYSEGMLEKAKDLLNRNGYHDVEFCRADAQHLPFADASFDAVVSRNLVWNLEDPEAAYKEWLRVLKPGGKLCAFEPIIRSNTRYWEILDPMYIDRYEDFKRVENKIMENPLDSLCNFDEHTLETNLEIAGFSIPEVKLQEVRSRYVVQPNMVREWFINPPSPNQPSTKERYLKYFDEQTVEKFMQDVQNYLTGREISLKTNAVFINATK